MWFYSKSAVRLAVTAILFRGTLFAAAPTIFQVLDPVRPDQALLLFGADVGPDVKAEGQRIPDEAVLAPPEAVVNQPKGSALSLEVLQPSVLSAKVVIPADWKAGIYAVRLRNSDGEGEWKFANRPQIWWQLSGAGGIAHPGEKLRVFGKNLGEKSALWLEGEKGAAIKLPVEEAREFDVVASLPTDLAVGRYRIWAHNGYGGMAGFGEPLAVEVATAKPWPTTTFNVHDFGAKGDNHNDDTFAIRRTLAWAGSKGGGVVYFPPGTYLITNKLSVPAHTTVRGAGRDAVFLKVPVFWPERPKLLPTFDAVFAGSGEFGIEDLTLIARSAHRLVVAPDIPDATGESMAYWQEGLPKANGVALRRLRLQHLRFAIRPGQDDPRLKVEIGPTTIAVRGADFRLEDSEVVSSGMPIQIDAATRAVITRNILRTGRNGWYGLWNFNCGLFEGNDVSAADLMGSSGGVQGACFHVMFRKNRWHGIFGGEREALTFDTPYEAAWMGTLVTGGGASATINSTAAGEWPPKRNYPGDLLAVVAGGRGIGQTVPVKRWDGSVIELAGPFSIKPNAKSLVVLSARKSRVLVVENHFEDVSVTAQLYAQSHEFLIAKNTAARTGGSYAHATDYWDGKVRRYSYALFNQWLNNVFEAGLVFDQGPWKEGFVGYTSHRSKGFKISTPAIGNRFVGNRLSGGTRMGGRITSQIAPDDLKDGAVPLAQDSIFEANELSQRNGSIQIDRGQSLILVRKNREVFSGIEK